MDKNQPTVYWNLVEAALLKGGLDKRDILTENECRRFDSFRFEKRREEWLLGRTAAKKLLVESNVYYKRIKFNDLSVENEPEGAPYFVVNGQPIDCSLSISHRDRLAFCALVGGNKGSIGADIEKIEPRPQVFVEDYFTKSEQKVIQEKQWEGPDVPVTLIWSAKEAVLKAMRKGLRLDTREVEVSLIGAREDEWGSFIAHSQYFNGEKCLGRWRTYSGYILTLALLNKAYSSKPSGSINLVQVA